MKVLTFARAFPKGHPKEGQPTYFVESILASIHRGLSHEELSAIITPDLKPYVNDFVLIIDNGKHHTIRAGNRWKAGDMASLRVWSDKAYRSKQVEFAQVEVKKVWDIEINNRFGAASFEVVINGVIFGQLHFGNDNDVNPSGLNQLANNDGLELKDFVDWFNIHPKKNGLKFIGQIIAWNETINYR